MQRLAPSRKRVHFLALTALIALGVFLLEGCREQAPPSAPAVASPAAAPTPAAPAMRTKQQAMNALMSLPELKAWSSQIEKASGGKVRGALVEYDGAPKVVNGKSYWQLSFVENASDAAHPWESFLVAQAGEDILVEDDTSDQVLTLEQWRTRKRPMQRTSAYPVGG